MAYNGSGVFLINSAGQPVVANTVISATVFNALTSDLATGLSTAITKDGQTTITNNIPFGSNKITGLGSGTAAADAANLGQVQSTVAKLITVTGTDTITGSMSPQLTAYAAGQLFYFVANAANTSAVTLNIDSLGAKNITRDGSSALAAGDINSGEVVVVIYDGTRFQMINAANSFGNTTINGTLTVTGNAGFQANVSITSALSVGGVFAVTGAATFTANPTLSGGTANGVLYLNGSKVATSGSALVFDGTNLGIGAASPGGKLDVLASSGVATIIRNSDATNGFGLKITAGGSASSRYAFHVLDSTDTTSYLIVSTATGSVGNVGIGTTSPTRQLSISNASQSNIQLTTTGAGSTITDGFQLQFDGSSNYVWGYENVPTLFGTNNTERMRLDTSGRLGLGTTAPSYKLTIADTTNQLSLTTGTNELIARASSTEAALYTFQAIPLNFYTNNALRATIDSSGNLGLGVTPSAWSSAFGPVIQVKTGSGGGALTGSSTDNFRMFANTFYDGSYKRIGAGYATQYEQASGAHAWYTAGTSTASSAITFTQAMTLDASGRLGIGTTSPGQRLVLAQAGDTLAVLNNTTAAYNSYIGTYTNDTRIGNDAAKAITFYTNGSERGRFTAGGDLLVGTTSSLGKFTVQNVSISPSNESEVTSIRIQSTRKSYPTDNAAVAIFSLSKGAATGGSGFSNFVGVVRVTGFIRGQLGTSLLSYDYTANVHITQYVSANITMTITGGSLTTYGASLSNLDVASVTLSLSSASATAATLNVTVDVTGADAGNAYITSYVGAELDGMMMSNVSSELLTITRA